MFIPLLSPLAVISTVFRSLLSLGIISSVRMDCSLITFPSCPWFTFLFLSITSLFFFLALLTQSYLRFPPRRGPPFGPSLFHIRFFFALFSRCLSFACPSDFSASVSFCSYSASSPVGSFSGAYSLLRSRVSPLPWFACRGFFVCGFFSFCCFFDGCRIRILLLLSASASFQLCLPSVALLCYLCLPSFLSLGYLLPSPSVSRATVPFDWFVCSGSSRLLLSPRLLSWVLMLFLLGRFFVSSVY